jgi:hypothetical protein
MLSNYFIRLPSCIFFANITLELRDSMQRTSTVLVTALYDIGRAKGGDGRTFNDYLRWFKETLKLRSPMVVYGEESLRGFVIKHRPPSYPTRFVAMSLKDLPYASYVEGIAAILNQKPKEQRNTVEERIPLYNAIQFSKLEWLRMASEEKWNVLDTSRLASRSGLSSTTMPSSPSVWLWVDAGISRFFGPLFPLAHPWPHRAWSQKIEASDQIWIQGNPVNDLPLDGDGFIGSHSDRFTGTIFGGNIQAVRWLAMSGKRLFEKDMLSKNRIDNEQVGLALLAKRCPERFSIIYRIPDFSSGARMIWHYLAGTMAFEWIPWARWLSYGFGVQKPGELYGFVESEEAKKLKSIPQQNTQAESKA